MKRLALFLLLASAVASAVTLDTYGGRTDISCTVPAAGGWSTAKIGNRWWICTPAGHVFYWQSVFHVAEIGDSGTKYPNRAAWQAATAARFDALGVNGNMSGEEFRAANPRQFAFLGAGRISLSAMQNARFVTATGTHVFQTYNVKNLCYSLSPNSTGGWCPEVADYADPILPTQAHRFFTESTQYALSWYASPYLLAISIDDGDEMFPFSAGDQCDANGKNCANSAPVTSLAFMLMTMSPTQAQGCGVQFTNCGTGASNWWTTNFDVEVKSKTKAIDTLKAKYGTVTALNAAWGSTYTTSGCNLGRASADGWGSCGTQITGETLATADGRTTAYSNHTLASQTASNGSIQVVVNGTPVCGFVWANGLDYVNQYCNNVYVSAQLNNTTQVISGLTFYTAPTATQARTIDFISTDGSTVTVRTLWPHGLWHLAKVTVSGTTSGNFDVTAGTVTAVPNEYEFQYAKAGSFATQTNTGSYALATPFVPQAGDTITVNYIQNGWGIGNGVLDEDGRHSWISLAGTSGAEITTNLATVVISDFDLIDHDVAYYYFNGVGTQYRADLPKLVYLGIDGLSNYGWPARRGLLKAAGETHDAMLTAYNNKAQWTQASLDYIYASYGDHPFIDSFYPSIQDNNCFVGGLNNNPLATHAAFGTAYYNRAVANYSASYSNAANPIIGLALWTWADFSGDGCGLVSGLDNRYDGHESVTSTVTCSAPLDGSVVGPYSCGGESANYTDSNTGVANGNAIWLTGAANPRTLPGGWAFPGGWVIP